jgi:hypothetical protein
VWFGAVGSATTLPPNYQGSVGVGLTFWVKKLRAENLEPIQNPPQSFVIVVV